MSFVANQTPLEKMRSLQRKVTFWFVMIALTAFLWRFFANGPLSPSTSYTDFMKHVDRNEVANVRLVSSPSTTLIEGRLRQPPQDFQVRIPKETVSDLTERLRKQGVSIEVVQREDANWASLIGILFVAIFFLGLLLAMRRTYAQRLRNAGVPPQNRPLGD